MSADLGPGPNSRVRRLRDTARYDEATVFSILDAAQFCHVSAVVNGRAMALPTLHVREGRRLYLHGSVSNALLRAALAAKDTSVTATIYDGIRLARSGFESSIAYRSVVCFGTLAEVPDADALRVLDLLVDAVVPGRSSEVRAPSPRERSLTRVVAFDIVEASAKVSAGPTDDDEVDLASHVWSGVLPAWTVHGEPWPSFDGAMADGSIAVPDSVRAMLARPWLERAGDLRAQVLDISPVDAREGASIGALVDRLEWPVDPFSERVDPRHVTASAFVVSPRGVILHRHRHLGIWVQPGGHIDLGEDPLAAAQREVIEETGLHTTALAQGRVVHVDLHLGPRGHTHYDLRYLLWNDGDDPTPPAGESPDVSWFEFDAAIERAEPALGPALARIRDLVTAGRGTLET